MCRSNKALNGTFSNFTKKANFDKIFTALLVTFAVSGNLSYKITYIVLKVVNYALSGSYANAISGIMCYMWYLCYKWYPML